ncbi:16S rRNA (cytidine(1402)-2'-O)-methyltransferase [Salinisphaera sp. Q1T1-3]|uniref:16S rRNA (cytidine(1402)-2'-O)-methyltransferase n=1 Tax=Salinisphaera sp. Q1T1-3 TaxID=2321229 RepID=UPI000E734889|nr:16S rRNA (cytidine(1402)-2'-O)-methyltransferase [Salinisphaera sp. Q1T1-3]RJS92274.1 16S rRNA (cytidine(1402)-2'-O)-methyltransferase [Salinisphaera sp. Q1T1-3]
MQQISGTLWIVATPIGNLADLAPRAADILATVDVIAAEDTRHTARLLTHLGIDTPRLSLHEHNEADRVPQLVGRLARGENIALVSDAGTPLISDPGYRLVAGVREAGHVVQTVPGPCAAIAALSVAGLPTDRFVFEGFLPARPANRRTRLAELADESRTLVCYESSHRICATADDLGAVLGTRPITLARELTKRYEQSVTLGAERLPEWLAADSNRQRGEFVLVIAGAPTRPAAAAGEISLDALLEELLPLAGTKKASTIAARLTGVAKKTAYARALALSE